MTAENLVEPATAVDIAHESRSRRRSFDLPHPNGGAPGLDGLRIDAGRRIRVALLVGADPRIVQAARRAVLASAIEEVITLRVGEAAPFGDDANDLRRARPDVVIVQSDDRDSDALVDLVEALRAACVDQDPPPLIVACGPHAERLAGVASPFPSLILEDLRRPEALAAFVSRMRSLRLESDLGIVLRDDALESLARLFARATGAPALVVDVTGSSTSIVRAEADGSTHAAHEARLGMGTSADRVVARAGLDRVRRWIPRAVDAPSLLERVFNRARWPDAGAASPLALALEIALAHEAIAHTLTAAAALGPTAARLRGAPTVVLTGRLADLPKPAQSLLVAVNALETDVVGSFVRERADGLVALGALAARMDDWDSVLGLLPVHSERLALVVPLQSKRSATLKVSGGGMRHEQRFEPGSFTVLSLEGQLDVACGSPEVRAHGDAGSCGVLVDARVRPLVLPPRDAERVPTVSRWFESLKAMPA